MGTTITGIELVVLRTMAGHIDQVWWDEGEGIFAVINRVLQGSGAGAQVVVDSTTTTGRLLVEDLRRSTMAKVVEASPNRPQLFGEMHVVIDQAMVVYHLLQLAQLSSRSMHVAEGVRSLIDPAIRQTMPERQASIPNTPPAPRPAGIVISNRLAIGVVILLVSIIGLMLGRATHWWP